MLSKQTVLVLGAGASFEIDMCLGETLMKEIGHQVNMQFEAGHRKGGSDVIYEALRKLAIQSKQDINVLHAAGRQIARGISTAGSIDNYIHHHRNDAAIKAVGKIAIVNAILQYERKSKVFIDETKHPKVFRDVDGLEKTWLHSFFRLLGEGIVVAETLEGIFDNVSVINFNYDRCFEQYLWLSLQNRFSIGDEAATALMKKLRIHHPYGTVARLPWDDRNGVSLGADPYRGELDLHQLSINIRTYNEEVEQGDKLEEARNWLNVGSRVVFLGFHFHDQNVELMKSKLPNEEGAAKYAYATVLSRSGPEQM